MEFDLDVKTELCGKVTITDYAKDFDLYLSEDEEPTTYDSFKYSESVTLNGIFKVTLNTATLLEVLLVDHDDSEYELSSFDVAEDGYYVINHIVMPTKSWYDNASDEYKAYYDTIYIVDNDVIYKEVNGELKKTDVEEVLNRNPNGTTIQIGKVDVFYTGHLQECYMGYCRKIFNELMSVCAPKTYNEDIWARDFIYMTLSIIDYLTCFKQYMEAQRILELISGCGGFCSGRLGESVKRNSGCGCSKA